jgi:hypothetical protein
MTHYDKMRARNAAARRWARAELAARLAAETPPAVSPELTEPTAEEIAEAEAAEERYLAGNLRKYYFPGELGQHRRSELQD